MTGNETILASLPFNQKDCEAIVAMPISFNFMEAMIGCVKTSLGVKTFDLLGIPGFSKRFSSESKVVLNTIELAVNHHNVKRIIIFQHVDFHNDGKSSRYDSLLDEDYNHKKGLIESLKKLRELYPEIGITLIYARLTKGNEEIEFSQIFEDGSEKVRLLTPYLFKGVNTCKTTVIQCLDYRFRSGTRLCVQEAMGVSNFNIIGIPGAVKSFLEQSRAAWKGIEVAYNLHSCRKFILFQHQDCGAYGGSGKFNNSTEEEDYQRGQLLEAKEEILKKYPGAEIQMVYIRLTKDLSKMQFVLIK